MLQMKTSKEKMISILVLYDGGWIIGVRIIRKLYYI